MALQNRVRAVLGGPLSRGLELNVPLSKATLEAMGKIIVDSIVKEAKKDFAYQGNRPTPEGKPEGIPSTEEFFKSFAFHVRGDSTIEITSSWPWISQVIEGRKPYPMTWLVQPGVNQVPIMQRNGTVLIRTAPFTIGDAWIHPGFAKHTFVQRGIRKAKSKLAEAIAPDLIKALNRSV